MESKTYAVLRNNVGRWIAFRYAPNDNWTIGVIENVRAIGFSTDHVGRRIPDHTITVYFRVSGRDYSDRESGFFELRAVSEESIDGAFLTLTLDEEPTWRKRKI